MKKIVRLSFLINQTCNVFTCLIFGIIPWPWERWEEIKRKQKGCVLEDYGV